MRVMNLISRAACAAMFFTVSCLSSYADGNSVCLHLRSGEKVLFANADRPVLTFDDDNVVTIKDNTKNVSTNSFESVHKITFGDVAGVNDALVDSDGKIVAVGPRDIALVGFACGTPVTVVNINGVILQSMTVDDESAFVVSLEGYSAGVYVVTAGSANYKIAIK